MPGTGTSSPIVVPDLAAGNYTFTVTATNESGTSVASAPSAVVAVSAPLPPDVPGAPTAVVAVPGNAYCDVSFVAPASNGGAAITAYTVTASSGQTAAGSASPIRVTVPNGVPVTFTATATNVSGTGAASAASTSVIPSNVYVGPLGSSIITASSSTITVTTTAAVPVGRTVTIMALANQNVTATCVDSVGNSYSLDVSGANSTFLGLYLFSRRVTTQLAAGTTFTVTFSTARTLAAMYVHEWQGFATSGALDKTAVSTVTSGATALATAATAATAIANEVVIAAFGLSSGAAAVAYTPGVGYSAIGTVTALSGASSRDLFSEYRVLGATGAQTPSATASLAKPYVGVAATYRLA